jgi:hypothetical protein
MRFLRRRELHARRPCPEKRNVSAPGTVLQQNIIVGTLLSAFLIAPALAQIPYANPTSVGTWSPTDLYEVGAVVNYGATNYIALTKNVGMTPEYSSNDWAIPDSGPKRSPSEKSPAAELTGPAGAAGGTAAPRVTYVGPYIAGTRYSLNDVVTESGTSYIAITNGAREDPANDVKFSVGNWAVFSAENPRWTLSASGTAATPQPSGPKRSWTAQSLQRPVQLTTAEPKHKSQARDAFPGCNSVALPLDPFYQSRYLGADCGTVRTRTDYGVVGPC